MRELRSSCYGIGLTTEWLWVSTLTPQTGWCKRSYNKLKWKKEIKIAKWDTPRNI
jgi:hypothetical protein